MMRLLCAVVMLLMSCSAALADAGAIRASERHGNRQITVFTGPTPLRAGPVDVSIFIQDAETGQPLLDDVIDVEVSAPGSSFAPRRYRATSAAATNKLFQAAEFELPRAGPWQFTIIIHKPDDDVRIHFELEAGDSLPLWSSFWPWFCWPLLVIAIFAFNKCLGR